MSIQIPINTGVYHHPNEKVICSSCYSTDTQKIGDVKKGNSSTEAHKCNTCGLITLDEPSYVKALKDSVEYDSSEVTFVSSGTSVANAIDALSGVSEVNLDWESKDKLDQIKISMDNTNTQIVSLSGELTCLVSKIEEIIRENQKLQEKLTNDPLRGLRDVINNFNLK